MNSSFFDPEDNTRTCDTILRPNHGHGFIKTERAQELPEKRHKSKNDVAQSMEEMDRIYKTKFADWIRSESNIQYICTFKSKIFQEYLDKDQEKALYAFEWMTENWGSESVAELILKLFYVDRIDSGKFAERVHGIIRSWHVERIQELLPILLVGENSRTCAAFYANLVKVSQWDTEKMTELIYPIAYGFHWKNDALTEFLMEFTAIIVPKVSLQKSLIRVIYEEFKAFIASEKPAMDIFELLFQIIIDESRGATMEDFCKKLAATSLLDDEFWEFSE